MSETWTEWGVERGIWDGWNYTSRKVAPMRNRAEAERVAEKWAMCADNPVAVSRTVSASEWAPVEAACTPYEVQR